MPRPTPTPTPRPTTPMCARGSATVVLSALAMLLLSGASSGIGVAAIVLASLALGLLAAVAPALLQARTGRGSRTAAAEPIRTTALAPEPVAAPEFEAAGPGARS